MTVRKRSRWFGRTLVSVQLADDGGWDWTSDAGDAHRDLVAVSVVRRPGEPALLRLCLGPVMILAARKP